MDENTKKTWVNSGDDPCGPIQTRKINKALGKINWLHGTTRELNNMLQPDGTIKDYSFSSKLLFGGEITPEIRAIQDRIGEKHNWTISRAKFQEILLDLQQGEAEAWEFVPVIDKRKTLEELQAEKSRLEIQREEETKKEEGRLKDCPEIPEGMSPVLLQITFDDSDGMTDYYCPHSTLETFTLGFVNKKSPESERLARSIIARYSKLKDIAWEWKTEKWSMGHGNYLISKDIMETRLHKAYNGRAEVGCRYEITFGYSDRYKAHPDYPGDLNSEPVNNTLELGETTIRHNIERNGLEVRFSAKPHEDILSWLKAQGFRWSKFQKMWYISYTPELETQARQFLKPEPLPVQAVS